MPHFSFLNIFLASLSSVSCYISAKLYFNNLEKDVILAKNKEQMEKLIQLNEKLETLSFEQTITKAVPLMADDNLTSSYFSYFTLPSISVSGVLLCVVVVIISISFGQLVIESTQQIIDSNQQIIDVNQQTLDILRLSQYENSNNGLRLLYKIVDTDRKVTYIEKFVKGFSSGTYNFNSASTSLPDSKALINVSNTFASSSSSVFSKFVDHTNTISNKIPDAVATSSEFFEVFGSTPPPGI